jgi:hypothetical protein
MIDDHELRSTTFEAPLVAGVRREDYAFANPGRCRSCDALIGWWTTPRGNRSPHDPDGTSHFATCPTADRWRK